MFSQIWDLTHLNNPEVREEDAEGGARNCRNHEVLLKLLGKYFGNAIKKSEELSRL